MAAVVAAAAAEETAEVAIDMDIVLLAMFILAV